jgi:hypothetical protein
MKRRHFLQGLAVLPAVPAAFAKAPSKPLPEAPQAQSTDELPKLESSAADAAAEMMPRLFNAEQFAALRKLSDVLVPSIGGMPGALDAKAPEFLDFLVGASPEDRQRVYKTGLDKLNASAKSRFGKSFAEVDASQAETILAPLRQPWTYEPPADPLARFLQAAKQDVRAATFNSREWNVASSAAGRRGVGVGQYWYTIE